MVLFGFEKLTFCFYVAHLSWGGNKMTEDDKVLFDPADYDDSGCPKVPFAFAGMTGKTTSCIISKR